MAAGAASAVDRISDSVRGGATGDGDLGLGEGGTVDGKMEEK